MAVVVEKVRTVGSTLWNHKKKVIFFSGLAAYGFNWLQLSNRDSRIRTYYALEAKKYGDVTISPTEKLKRVTVLVNEAANNRKVSDNFKKNALPLLHLAGLDVTLLKVKDEEEMEALGRALDRTETDCIYVVGGDGTLSRVVSGMFAVERTAGTGPPLCVFPGGRHNFFLRQLAPGIFGETNDVRHYCESAMAILEETRRDVFPMKCEIINNASPDEKKPHYILSDVRAGWLEHCEQRKPKLWYLGGLRDRVVYLLEFLKRFPESMSLHVSYIDYCAGCKRCRRSLEERAREQARDTCGDQKNVGKPSRRTSWLSGVLGSWNTNKSGSSTALINNLIDYSNVINDNCGMMHTLAIDTADLAVSCKQEKDGCRLRLEARRPFFSRFDAIRVGWTREASASTDTTTPESQSEFTQTNVPASQVIIHFAHMPEFVQKLSIAGDWAPFENSAEKSLRLTAVDRRLELYAPLSSKSRIELENC